MTTDQKIREAYEQAVKNDPYISSLVVFTGGYKAALDDLISVGYRNAPYDLTMLYRLPEGVTKP